MSEGGRIDGVDAGGDGRENMEIRDRDCPSRYEAHHERWDSVTDGRAVDIGRQDLRCGQGISPCESQRFDLTLRGLGLVFEDPRPHVAAEHREPAVGQSQTVNR